MIAGYLNFFTELNFFQNQRNELKICPYIADKIEH